MRILHVSSGNLYGGVETVLATLASSRDFCPDMEQHFAFSFAGRASEEVKGTGTPVYQVGEVRLSRPWSVRRARQNLREVLRQHKFDVVLCHSAWPLAVFGPAAKGLSKLGFWLHDWCDGRSWVDRMARRVEPDFAICNSHFTATAMPNLFPKTGVKVVHCPVKQASAAGPGETRREVRERMHAGSEEVAILQVSRMEDWKGHLLHLQALARLRETANWTCWFAGGAQRPEEQEYVSKLKESAKALGIAERVRFLGQRTDVPELLAAADIFCQPNKSPEPFGIVFIEAMLAGLPIVATAMGGALEIVDGTCGVLVPPGDAAALADALQQLIESPEKRRTLGGGGPARAQLLCDPKAQLEKLKRTLSEV